MNEINHIEVIIDGDIYELSSPENPEYIQRVASYIDKKIKSIYSVKSEGSMNPRLKSLFISLNIADDLFKEKEENEKLKNIIDELRSALDKANSERSSLDEEVIRLNDRISSQDAELYKARSELEEYIEAFELEEEMNQEAKLTRLKR